MAKRQLAEIMKAAGAFEVNLSPLDVYAAESDRTNFGQMCIDKNLTEGLTATSNGEMLGVLTAIKGFSRLCCQRTGAGKYQRPVWQFCVAAFWNHESEAEFAGSGRGAGLW